MPATKKTSKRPENGPPAVCGMPGHAESAEVLTLGEAATYLRISEAEVVRMVHTQGLPGRGIGEHWRFLKSALQDWLRTPRTSKRTLQSVIGSWKDDPDLDEMLKEIYQRRGRPMIDEGK